MLLPVVACCVVVSVIGSGFVVVFLGYEKSRPANARRLPERRNSAPNVQKEGLFFFGSLFVESLVCCVQPITPFLFPHCIIKRIQGTLCRSPVSLIYSLLVLFALLVTGSSSGAFRFRTHQTNSGIPAAGFFLCQLISHQHHRPEYAGFRLLPSGYVQLVLLLS